MLAPFVTQPHIYNQVDEVLAKDKIDTKQVQVPQNDDKDFPKSTQNKLKVAINTKNVTLKTMKENYIATAPYFILQNSSTFPLHTSTTFTSSLPSVEHKQPSQCF